MLEKSFGLLFFLKQSQNQNDDRFIYLKITVDGKSKELSTKRKCDASKWNSHAGRAVGNKEAVKELNNYLDVLENQVYQAKRKLIESNKEVSVQSVKVRISAKVPPLFRAKLVLTHFWWKRRKRISSVSSIGQSQHGHTFDAL